MTAIAGPIFAPPPAPAHALEPVETVLARLEAPVRRRSASPIGSSLAAVLSFGLLPLWIWPQRWQAAVEQDRQDLAALAAWWGRQSAPTVAGRLQSAAQRIGGGAGVGSVLLTGVALATSLLITWSLLHGVSLEHIGQIVYQQRPWPVFHLPHHRLPPSGLGGLWAALLFAAYGLHYLQVRSHATAVKRYLSAVDMAGQSQGIGWPRQRYAFRGLGLMWIVCGLAMCGSGLWWGAPLVLAGARQREYLRNVRPAMRLALAKHARAALAPQPARFARCSTSGCRATLPSAARFCPRCGAMV